MGSDCRELANWIRMIARELDKGFERGLREFAERGGVLVRLKDFK